MLQAQTLFCFVDPEQAHTFKHTSATRELKIRWHVKLSHPARLLKPRARADARPAVSPPPPPAARHPPPLPPPAAASERKPGTRPGVPAFIESALGGEGGETKLLSRARSSINASHPLGSHRVSMRAIKRGTPYLRLSCPPPWRLLARALSVFVAPLAALPFTTRRDAPRSFFFRALYSCPSPRGAPRRFALSRAANSVCFPWRFLFSARLVLPAPHPRGFSWGSSAGVVFSRSVCSSLFLGLRPQTPWGSSSRPPVLPVLLRSRFVRLWGALSSRAFRVLQSGLVTGRQEGTPPNGVVPSLLHYGAVRLADSVVKAASRRFAGGCAPP